MPCPWVCLASDMLLHGTRSFIADDCSNKHRYCLSFCTTLLSITRAQNVQIVRMVWTYLHIETDMRHIMGRIWQTNLDLGSSESKQGDVQHITAIAHR